MDPGSFRMVSVMGSSTSGMAGGTDADTGVTGVVACGFLPHSIEGSVLEETIGQIKRHRFPHLRKYYSPLAPFCNPPAIEINPALVPDMTCKGMEVAEGSDAGVAWEKMVHAEGGSEERGRLRDALLAYCKQDTLAMVRLLDVLRSA